MFGSLRDTFPFVLFFSLFSLNEKMVLNPDICALLGQLLCLITSYSLTDYVSRSIVDFKVEEKKKNSDVCFLYRFTSIY